MIEKTGDLWELAKAESAPVVITTNSSVKKNGRAVMGAGCALEAKDRFADIDLVLGQMLARDGNHVAILSLGVGSLCIVSFPTKYNWFDKSDLTLIKRSARELAGLMTDLSVPRVIMPRPGCGYGGLRWSVVKPVLEPILDDRFIVVHREGE